MDRHIPHVQCDYDKEAKNKTPPSVRGGPLKWVMGTTHLKNRCPIMQLGQLIELSGKKFYYY